MMQLCEALLRRVPVKSPEKPPLTVHKQASIMGGSRDTHKCETAVTHVCTGLRDEHLNTDRESHDQTDPQLATGRTHSTGSRPSITVCPSCQSCMSRLPPVSFYRYTGTCNGTRRFRPFGVQFDPFPGQTIIHIGLSGAENFFQT